ncbi:HAD family hydrolase [Haliangium ochraceum]|uniref:HAD-superfamily subfamily IB hydrolase, TIGR01490 n=1 Tax=Haliangium ochraceum (strain DSM 14365 / JCM 11303 / SMP-2) TaxID=502025 RepID=D0LK02_HALO1|nr:HAD-IB family hydrolase [Haliangium ochraceum]ACY18509.1 HAD-superfamily subfamily IB hydrolase, TIGR01490 [Haliangium ochraceum DSM 14365]
MTARRVLRRAAFFDLDRTVLRIDTGTSWMRYLYERGELSMFELARVLYWGLLYRAAVLDMEAVAQRLAADFAGNREAEVIAKSRLWHLTHIADQVTATARETIERHRQGGDLVVLLTGTTQYAAEAVGRGLDIEHTLSSRVQVREGVFTGKLDQLCFGPHKVSVAERFANEHRIDLSRSYFYSDSYNDMPMLRRVGVPVAVNPDARLRRHARRSGWRIEHWH